MDAHVRFRTCRRVGPEAERPPPAPRLILVRPFRKERPMWRRYLGGRMARRAMTGSRRTRGFRYSFGTVVLLVSAAILLFLYLTGRLAV
jgi:hypothetical protein